MSTTSSPWAIAIRLFLLGTAICPLTAAWAGTLRVNPILVSLDADHRSGSVTVRNDESTPVAIRAYPLAWAQAGGSDVYAETSAVIVSPPVFTIAPGGTQLVRVGLRYAAGTGRAYRLIIEEVPEAASGGGVRAVLRLNLPLYAGVRPGVPGDVRWAASRAAGGDWIVEAANSGDGYVRLDPELAAAATGLSFSDEGFGTVLPGATRRWRFDGSIRVADRALLQQILRTSDSGATRTAQSSP